MDGKRGKARMSSEPILFNVLLADLEKEMGKVKWRGVKLWEGRVYTLAYTDDIILLAKEEDEIKSMIGRLEGYLDKKGLELNTGKTKIMRFRKGAGRKWEERWKR